MRFSSVPAAVWAARAGLFAMFALLFTTHAGCGEPASTRDPEGCDGQGECGDFFTFGCRACGMGIPCGKEAYDCQSTNGCANILNCEAKCEATDQACQKECEGPNPDGVVTFHALTNCLDCQACPKDCAESAKVCSSSPPGTSSASSGP